MPKTDKKPRVDPAWVQDYVRWGVVKYGISLWVNHLQPPLFFDGASLDVEDDEQGNFVGLGIYGQDVMGSGFACYYWNDWELAKKVVIPKFIAHNGKTDLFKLQKWGFKVTEDWLLWDTQLIGHILDSSLKRYGLKDMVKRECALEYPSYEDLCGKKTSKNHTTLDKLECALVAEYNAMDTYSTHQLYQKQKKECDKYPERAETYFNRIEKPVSFLFGKMEERGIRIDLEYLRSLKITLEAQQEPVKASILNELGPINLDSPKQLLVALIAKGIKPELKGKLSTDKRALERFKGIPIADNLLQYSEINTLLTVFVNKYLERNVNVIHPHYLQTGTRTGRPSCSDPNLLQIPRRTKNGELVRKMFIAKDGHLLGDCDFGQIEPRVLAHLSKDPTMLRMFNEGVDFHSYTAERLRIDRERAKILNLSVGYRATHRSVSQQLKCSFNTAQAEINKWWSLFPNLYDWQQKIIFQAKKDGYCTTLLGRRIKIDDLSNGNDWRREGAERQLINNITQGSAAEIMKMAMLLVDKHNINILVQVYDELLFESPEETIASDIEIVKECMMNCIKLDVPLTVDAGIGLNWAEQKGN